MHSSIFSIRSLQTSVLCPWSLWNSHQQFQSLLWGDACNGVGSLKRSLGQRNEVTRRNPRFNPPSIDLVEHIWFCGGHSLPSIILYSHLFPILLIPFVVYCIISRGKYSGNLPHVLCWWGWEVAKFLVKRAYPYSFLEGKNDKLVWIIL